MKITLIQMNSTESRDKNVSKACDYIDRAAEAKADLVVLPEFFNNLYFPQYRDYKYIDWAEQDDGYTMSKIKEKAQQHQFYIVATIYEEEAAGVYYDTAIVIDPQGNIIGKYRKTHPAAAGSLEKIYFRFGSKYPVFRINEWKVGIIICYDTFFPEAARCVALNGAELIVIPWAGPDDAVKNKNEMRINAIVNRAYENATYVAACNKVGPEGEWVFRGSSIIVNPAGAILAEATTKEDDIITAELDKNELYKARISLPVYRDRRPDLYQAITTPTENLPYEN